MSEANCILYIISNPNKLKTHLKVYLFVGKLLIVTVWYVSWLCSMIDTQTENALHAFNDEEQPRHFNKSSNLDVQCMSLRINGIQAYGHATII